MRRWGLWEVIGHEGGALMDEISILIKRLQRAPLPLPPCEDTVRRQLSKDQEVGPHQTPNLPGSWTSCLQN